MYRLSRQTCKTYTAKQRAGTKNYISCEWQHIATIGFKQVNQLINQTEACCEATLACFFFFFSNWRILHYLLTCLASLAVTAEGVGFQGSIWVRNRVFKARNLNNKPVESLINKPYQIQYAQSTLTWPTKHFVSWDRSSVNEFISRFTHVTVERLRIQRWPSELRRQLFMQLPLSFSLSSVSPRATCLTWTSFSNSLSDKKEESAEESYQRAHLIPTYWLNTKTPYKMWTHNTFLKLIYRLLSSILSFIQGLKTLSSCRLGLNRDSVNEAIRQ